MALPNYTRQHKREYALPFVILLTQRAKRVVSNGEESPALVLYSIKKKDIRLLSFRYSASEVSRPNKNEEWVFMRGKIS